MQKFLLSLTILVTSSMLTQSLSAMRCGDRLILRNDHISKVQRFCGEPESHTSKTVYRTVSRYSHFYHTSFHEEVPVVLEEMVFNFGPNAFMRLVKIENGIVKEVKTLDYGYRD